MDPKKLDKYLYIRKTPTWFVRGLYGFGIFSWILLLPSYWDAAIYDPFYRYFSLPIVVLLSVYIFLSYGLMLFYKRFDVTAHFELIHEYWGMNNTPTIDILLPICGEDISILINTWKHVSQIDYSNFNVFVLDDSKDEQDEHKRIAEEFGFTYFERPNKGETKKAGNLKYGYEHTQGEFVVVFDADFAPHPDFIKEQLPYMRDPHVAIVQSPQYFETRIAKELTAWEYFGARGQEVFYRFSQPARDVFSGAVCCGSNAIYRRASMACIGGSVLQVEYGEDTRTAMALMMNGWKVKYIPVILAVGLSPDNPYAFFHQQHRWCMSSMHQVLDVSFWTTRKLTWKQKWCYLTGYTFYLHSPLIIIFSFQLFWTLFFYNQYISFGDAFTFLPYMLFSILLLPMTIIQRFRFKSLYGYMLLSYAATHAIITAFLNQTGTWIPTNAKHSGVSSIYRQVATAIAVYLFIYLTLVALSLRIGALHLLNYNYLPIQFWVFYNIILGGFLLWELYRYMEAGKKEMVVAGALSPMELTKWQFKTAGLYTFLVTGIFFAVLYL